MNAKEYLGRLDAALGAMPGPEREDFLREMESHIEDLRARRPGEGEEAVVSGLTPPELLAAELLGEAGGEERPRRAGRAGRGASAGGSRLKSALEALSRLDELSEELGKLGALGDLARRFRPRGRGEDAAGEAVFIRVDEPGVAAVRLDLAAADLEILPADSGAIRIEARGIRPAASLEHGVSDGTFTLRELVDSGDGLDRIKIELPATVARVEVKGVSGDVRAAGIGAELRLVSASGDVDLRDLGRAFVQTASGDIAIGGAASVELATASGDVDIAGVRGEVVAKTASGDISVSSAGGPVRVDSAGGDIELRSLRDRVDAKSISGEIGIEDCPGEISASSRSGSVDADLRSGFGGLSATALSGDIAVRLPPEPRAAVEAESRSGDVAVGAKAGSAVRIDLGGGGPRLALKSLAGDVSVTW